MEITDKTFIAGVWFVYGKQPADWMANVFREGDGPWQIEYRFRYYSPEKSAPFDEKDEKSWGGGQAQDGSDATRELVIAAANHLAKSLVATGFNDKFDHVEVMGGPDVFLEKISKMPWAHMKHAEQGGPKGDG